MVTLSADSVDDVWRLLAPIILETSRQARFLIPMAISLGFGILFATAMLLMIVPCFYMVVEDTKALTKKVTG